MEVLSRKAAASPPYSSIPVRKSSIPGAAPPVN